MTEEKIYSCLFVNKREAEVDVWDFGAQVLLHLKPGAEFEVEMYDAKAAYAPFSKVVYLPNDKVEVHWSRAWKHPWKSQWWILLHNIDGEPLEMITIDDRVVHCCKGIPRIAPVSVRDPLVKYRKIEWKLMKNKERRLDFPDYIRVSYQLERVTQERSKRDLAKIREAIEAEALAAAQSDLKRKFHKMGIEDDPQTLRSNKS